LLDVLVIGGGYWGSAITRLLRASELTVLCLDGRVEGAASQAAAGLVRAGAWEKAATGWWGERHSQACRDFFCDGWVEERVVSDYAPEPRVKGQVWCGEFPWEPAVSGRVVNLRAESDHWEAGPWQARQIVLAAGCWCDEILRASGLPLTGVKASRGTGLLGAGEVVGVLTRTYRLAGDTRTRSFSMRAWGAGVRVGDTLPEREAEQQEEMRRFLGYPGELVWGLRPRLSQPLVELWAPGLVVATGGYRNGLATAPGVARRVLELLSPA
jgi:glycine/D-amino acid oxidase-like deaminating enzyme